ncbi:MAG: MFS transporter, partial [Bifidobacterium sp.]
MSNTTTTANGTARRGKIGQRVAYACGNLGQSAFYNALSTYFVVYVTSSLFAGVD